MRLHSNGQQYAVFDEALNKEDSALARTFFVTAEMKPTFSPINRFHDGIAFKRRGPLGYLRIDDHGRCEGLIESLAITCIRTLFESVLTERQTWRYSCTYMAYPAGTQLSWHVDREAHDAVFNYYLNPWQANWGGELDLLDCSLNQESPLSLDGFVMDSQLNASSIVPRENRLVVMLADTPHRVRKIDALAGDNVRCAIAGSVKLEECSS